MGARDLRALREGRLHRRGARSSSSTTRRPSMLPARSLRQGHLPALRRRISTATAARSAAPPTRRPSSWIRSRGLRARTPVMQRVRAPVRQARALRATCCTSLDAGRGTLQTAVANKLDEWFDGGLRDWDISRDAPYFGFEIPDAPGKYFYVWLDAPVGYMSSTAELVRAHRRATSTTGGANRRRARSSTSSARTSSTSTRCSGRRCCTARAYRCRPRVQVHGLLTVNGEKMSKTRGTFVTARTLPRPPVARLPPLLLRGQARARASTTSTSTSTSSRPA